MLTRPIPVPSSADEGPKAATLKRSYRSPLRDEAAQQTRARIREAAGHLFIAQGYVAATMRQVAAAAGVAERTVYTAFPTKADLFKEVLGVAIVGDDRPIPVADRPEFRAALTARDGARAIALAVDHGAALLERAGDLIMTGERSADADPDMRGYAEEGVRVARDNFSALAQALARNGALRVDIDPAQAADVLFTLLSPYVHHLLRRTCGWSVDEYRTWLREQLVDALLPG